MSVPVFTVMTNDAFEAARDAHLQPTACLRCGRILMSRASIVRGYGSTCALAQALEELSHPGRNPKKWTGAKPVVTFHDAGAGLVEIADVREVTIGWLRMNARGVWAIVLWGVRVDFDADFDSAKRRVIRIIERMGR